MTGIRHPIVGGNTSDNKLGKLSDAAFAGRETRVSAGTRQHTQQARIEQPDYNLVRQKSLEPGLARSQTPQRFLFALVDDFTHFAFSCASEPLRLANLVSGKQLYTWSLASADGASAKSSNGFETKVHHRFDRLPACDMLFVLSGIDMQHKDIRLLVSAVRRERARGVQIGALCSGAHILARAGLLDGARAAIHWEYHDSFRQEFPQVDLVRSVFVADERCITASGGTAATDLMLHLIERKHGRDLSIAVAEQMVYSGVRTANSVQGFSLQARSGIRSRHLIEAIQIMRERIEEPPSAAEIARRIGITPRQVQRLFERYLQTTPKKYFLEIRLERARHLILQTETAVTEVAFACGFASHGHFSRLYKATYGESPFAHRQGGRLVRRQEWPTTRSRELSAESSRHGLQRQFSGI